MYSRSEETEEYYTKEGYSGSTKTFFNYQITKLFGQQ
jgi:hypothetical protein